MSRADLTRATLQLLLAALEAPSPVLSPALAERHRSVVHDLLLAGLIKTGGHTSVTTYSDDFSDIPVSLVWDADRGSYGYFSESQGWRDVPAEQITPYDVNIVPLLTALTQKCDVIGKAEEVVSSHLWNLGLMRIGNRPKRVPLLFGRRLNHADVREKVENYLRNRPSQERRVIMTSTNTDLLSGSYRGTTAIGIADAMRHGSLPMIDPEIVALRYDHMEAPRSDEPLVVLREGAEVRLLGRVYHFNRGPKRRKIICYMYEKYLQGQRWTASAELAVEAELGDNTRVRDVFKKSKAWDKLLMERDGMCGFCLPGSE